MARVTKVSWMEGAARSSATRISIGAVCALAVATFSSGRLRADVFPAGCDKASGGQGNTSTTGINFNYHQAHLGDVVQLFPTLGMVGPALPQLGGGCEALDATGSVYIASGLLVKFLDDVTLDPGFIYQCPTNTSPPCTAGPYNVTITPALVGAGVSYPEGSIGGAVNTVRGLQWSFSSHVRSNPSGFETLDKIDTASITILHPCILVTKQCVLPQGRACFNPGEAVVFTGYVTNCGDAVLTNVIANDTQTGRLVLVDPVSGLPLGTNASGGVTLTVGSFATYRASYVPTLVETCLGATTNSVTATGTDTSDIGGPNANVTSSTTTFCPICVVPGLVVTKACPAQPTPPGGTLTFSGTVTNTGNITLTNVTVVNNQPAPNTAVFGPVTLLPGAGASFTGSYTVPPDSCGPYPDTLTARGTTLCGQGITNTASATCPATNTPCISVTKFCTTNVVGTTQTISGTVSNCGNITLTNVAISDSVVGAVTNIGSLAPGASITYSKSFTAVCNGNNGTITATATSVCGSPVSSTATAPCVVTSTPCLSVTKLCTTNIIGAPQTVSGVVSNCGNITITNIIVSDNDDGINGTITTIPSLTPGQTQTYSVTYTATNCGPSSGTVTASGTSTCGQPVTATATAPCLTICIPSIKVYKQVVCYSNVCEPFNPDLTTQKTATGVSAGANCPAFCYRIVVTNTGNESLTGVTVTDNTMSLSSCFPAPFTLAPAGQAGSSATCIVTDVTHCTNTMNIVTATGTGSVPGGTTNVVSTDTNLVTVVPISVACTLLVSTDNGASFFVPSVCATQQLGLSYIVRIVVTNTGSYALQNVTVTSVAGLGGCLGAGVNLGSLAVGGSVIKDCTNTCATVGRTDYAVAVVAQASQAAGHICAYNSQGVLITTSSQCNTCVVCVGIPIIKVYKQVVCWTNICEQFNNDLTTQKTALGVRVDGNCPAFCYRFIVTNLGNITLTNVTVVDNTLDLSGCFPAPFTLAPAGQPNSSASCIVTDVGHCTDTVNIVTANGTGFTGSQSQNVTSTDTNRVTIVPISVICNLQVSTDNGATFTTPSVCATQVLNHSYIVAVGVTNNGQYALQNVTLTGSAGLSTCIASPLNLGGLAVGAGTVVYCTNNCASPGTTTFSASVVAEASQAAGHVCVYNTNGVKITASSQCSTCVTCTGLPKICVTKLIACFLGTNGVGADVCGTFGKSAIGVAGDTQNPAFCYSITVSNCGEIAMTNVTVIDDKYGNLSAHFNCLSPVFAPGASCTFEFKVELPPGPNSTINFVTNTVVADGQSIIDGTHTNATDSALAEIVPASISCRLQYSIDGGPLTNNATLSDQNTHSIAWYITVFNTGLANMCNITVTDEDSTLGCTVSIPPFCLDAGANSGPLLMCTNPSFTCTNLTGIKDTLMVTSDSFTYGPNHIPVCAHDLTGSTNTIGTNFDNIVVRSECNVSLGCQLPNACRVTGGGRQDSPLVYPDDVRYVTHGGQVGAPVGDRICVVLTNFFLGNPCIHGRWTHVRHMQGGLDGNFHARFYDTLDCACLDTNTTPATVTVPGVDGVGAQTYVNLVYGPATTVGGVCGNRNIGPLPRPAPANKIVFTGVGDWADPNGRRASRATLFRVDIEDRGEPGNSHALGANGKPGRVPDRYRIRIWVLTDAELAELNGSGPDQWLLNFRNAISACNGINVQDGAGGANGSAVFGVRAPDVDDGGELQRGNHQIHPMIKQCDPFNPNGPPLAKP